MQNKTINGALLALERDDGVQGNLARALLMLRGVDVPDIRQLNRQNYDETGRTTPKSDRTGEAKALIRRSLTTIHCISILLVNIQGHRH